MVPPADPVRPDWVEAVGQRMLVDHMTAEVVQAFGEAGVETMLLKEPAIARWLYERAADRSYADADLLVPPVHWGAATSALAALGFEPVPDRAVRRRGAPAPHADTWFRSRDHGAVDLHRCLHGTERLPPEVVWAVVSRGREWIDVFDQPVAVPREAVRAVHLVLHLRPKDGPGTRAWIDLERALDQLDPEVWQQAMTVAEELDVRREMGALLRLQPAGAVLADRLDLPVLPPAHLVAEHRRHAPGLTRFGYRLRRHDLRYAVRSVLRKAVPPAEAMRRSYPTERSGPLGLLTSHARRVASLPRQFRAWRAHRRSGGATRLR